MKVITAISRIIVGALFIFSGVIKANDTLGFAYKLEEYFTVFGTKFMVPYSPYLSIFICVMEVSLGVALLLGLEATLVTTLLLAMIIFFTFLTFWSAWFNVVTDCGCFGDFLKLTPWESFSKDIVLLVLIIILFINRKHIKRLFSKSLSPKIFVTALALSIIFPVYTYTFLPIWDFRPYKEGNNIKELMTIPEDAPKAVYENIFIYKNKETGEKKEFKLDNLPQGDNWDFVNREDKLIQEGYKPPIHDFTISSADGQKFTDSFLNQTGYRILIVQYDLSKTNEGAQKKVSDLFQKISQSKDINFWALTSSTNSDVENYRQKHDITYPYYYTDGTTLKTIVRSNPGFLLLENNLIIKKWPATDVPDMKDIEKYMQ